MRLRSLILVCLGLPFVSPVQAQSPAGSGGATLVSPTTAAPWLNRALPAERRARLLLDSMTLDEKITLVHTHFGTPFQGRPKPEGALNSAGFAPGIPRLAIPPLEETDAGLGVTNPTNIKTFNATALPSGLALGATFDPELARAGGAMIGAEARAKGFNVMLAGGADLTREPRNGRNFEYIGEDPLLTGAMVGAVVAGIQSQGLISTIKHFAINAQETGRVIVSSDLTETAARESDLLAFEIALERGAPQAVMTGYNRVNGEYASENAFLIKDVLKGDWRFKGWVMSDWGGTHSTEKAALAGLDQESGDNLDPGALFGAPLKAAIEAERVPQARLDDMVLRILSAELRAGVIDRPPSPGGAIDDAGHAIVAETVARNGIVLLKNDGGQLPLPRTLHHVLVIGDHADFGVLSGGGSSQVVPIGALRLPGDPPGQFFGLPKLYDPSSPLQAIRHELPEARIDFLDGTNPATAAAAARDADAVVLFAEQWMNEARDVPDLALPKGQDGLIAAVAAANPHTIVVLETGGPVVMPWLPRVPAVLEAWYPGARGAEAIAAVLFGSVAPSGRLPMTFPQDEGQLPRRTIPNPETTNANPGEPLKGPMFSVDYNIEGADVGYKWFARTNRKPLFPFGYGLSYTRFTHGPVHIATHGGAVTARFDVTNSGPRQGIDTPQLYIESADHLFSRRLGGWRRIALRPGETRSVSIAVDPRLFARFDTRGHCWRIQGGAYALSVRADALGAGQTQTVRLASRDLKP